MSEFPNASTTPPAHAVVTLHGASRDIYGFTAFPLEAAPARAGICVIVRPPNGGNGFAPSYWTPLYVQASAALAEGDTIPRRIVEQARQMGASHVLVHFCDRGDAVRRHIVEDLVAALHPPLNMEARRKAA